MEELFMNTWQDAVVQIVLILVTFAFTYFGKVLVKNKQALTLVQILTPLAKDAVLAAQKLGLDKDLTGAMQKSAAVQAVISGLAKAGFTKVDQQTIENAVEAAYATLKDTLDTVYSQTDSSQGTGEASSAAAPVSAAPASSAAVPASEAPAVK